MCGDVAHIVGTLQHMTLVLGKVGSGLKGTWLVATQRAPDRNN